MMRMLHLMKLAVGVRDVEELRAWQAERAVTHPPLRHRTRNFPRRAAEVTDGGSMYWVVSGAMVVRQRIVDIAEDRLDDGTRCTALILDHALVPVAARAMKPFQGWRYLDAADAPADIVRGKAGKGEATLPPELRRELQALCLL